MSDTKHALWARFQQYYREFPGLGLALDLSRMRFGEEYLAAMKPRLAAALEEMRELERGAIANRDENRMVGHYWLRNPALAPTPELRREIEQTLERVKGFVGKVHRGEVAGAKGSFENVLLVGIGGSALGPQFVADALGGPDRDEMQLFFLDNTDPDGVDRVFAALAGKLGQTLTVVISKSGGTKETRNGMLEAKAAYAAAGLDYARHTVAVTSQGSELDKLAVKENWLERFPMWDWVGGRTSELSAVGLLPAALQGIDIDGLLAGAKACDEQTRRAEFAENPAAQLALMWHYSGSGKGEKNLIVLPYKDRLVLFSKYLQQLIMESLGKALDRDGGLVEQGLTVLGNKGSTDQHAYVQQLRDGRNDFFVTFIEVLKDRGREGMEVEPGITTGDYLEGFLLGTRSALYDNGRESITITVRDVDPFSVGVLIALFERTVGLYASLVNLNAYHQPGVEAGKKAAGEVLCLQMSVMRFLKEGQGKAYAAQAIAEALGRMDAVETVFKICEHLAANLDRGILKEPGEGATTARFRWR
jgi:glucose-6-phosphate isomerase